MGRTLFLYLFKDLVKIFVLASVVLAGVMSLGGLLQPLTKFGLDASQVGLMWLYFMPAMMTYSMPVAAVFATSVVYGRLSADNELTACRAAGVSYGSILAPGVAMGLVAAAVSVVFLAFVVPHFFLEAEKVAKANVAKLIASSIERKHEFAPHRRAPTIFAQRAVASVTPEGEQVVVLDEPLLITRTKSEDPSRVVPKTFTLARKVTLYIRNGEDNTVEVSGVLEGVTSFQRELGSRPDTGVERTEFPPITMPSMLKQQTKFMNVKQLNDLGNHIERTDRVREAIKSFIQTEQQQMFYGDLKAALSRHNEGYNFGAQEHYQLTAPGAKAEVIKGVLYLTAKKEPIRLTIKRPDGRVARAVEARSAILEATMDNEASLVTLSVDLKDVAIPLNDQTITKLADQRIYELPMSEALKAIRFRKVDDYVTPGETNEAKVALAVARMKAHNDIITEMHSRASYSVSCLVLVLMGAVLGMQFKSGDYLTAFAISVIPALLSITLVVSGQQTATDVPMTLKNPLPFGLCLIWVGNAVAGLIALGLFQRIRKT